MSEKKSYEYDNAKNGDTKIVHSGDVEIQFQDKSKRTALEKILIAVVLMCVVVIIVLAIVAAIRKNDKESETIGVCTSTECTVAAARVTAALDETVDPCDNFYDFTCGTWIKKTIISEDRSSIDMFGVVRDEVEITIKYLLEEDSPDNEPEAVTKAKDLYKSCMNLELIEQHGAAVLKDLMAELGGWPMIGTFHGVKWNPDNFNLTNLLLGLLKYNNRILMDMYAYTDSKNSSTRILFIDQADFGMPGRKYYLKERNDTMIMAYETLGKSIAIQLGADPDVAANDMERVVDLEIDLAKITVPEEDRRDNEALYNKMPLHDLPKNFTTANLPFDWIDYVQEALGSEMVQIDIPIDEPIIVRAPLYFERLFSTLSKYDNRTIANFMIWRIMQNRANNLSQRFKDLIQNYNQILYGTSTPRARWRDCTSYVNTNFGLATGRLFVKESFHESAKNDTLQLIGNLLESFHELLEHADWMDDATRIVAREKADFIQKKIGYQDDIMDDEILNEIYQNITINADTYLANVLNVISSISADSFLFLREPVNKNVWSTAPATVNAYYNSVYNRIMFPAGILQPPFYSKDRPKSLNYGGIGVVIGHEITHGFDDRGRQYDKDGNLVQWWSDEVITRFDTQTQCLVNQYSNFTLPELVDEGLNVNGINTLGENIADNGGLKQSFRAYKRWVAENGEEKQLPGLKYNHDQLFFIGFAQVWCGSMRRESAINRILTGVHSPGRFRVIGTLQNSKDFSEAFSCRQGSYMNPYKKCYVW
ncbi:Hypothetical predicted protein [Mytilus galloprovincialis]|uniref:Uncharacterized protein n=1 Tax=Mytilus galloprovincialis TaxID=29158 RepID=A0A8B6F6M5_MYTGA|nr:Hypothetical predicted protein [Mytilus galloprovincialis]